MEGKYKKMDPALKIVLTIREGMSHQSLRQRLRSGCAICRHIAEGKLAPFVSDGILIDKEFALKFLAKYEKLAFSKNAMEKKEPKSEGRAD